MCQRVEPLSLQRRAEHKLTKAPASVEHDEDEEDAFYYLTSQMCLTDRVYLKKPPLGIGGGSRGWCLGGFQHGSVGQMQQVCVADESRVEGFLKQQKDGAIVGDTRLVGGDVRP